MKPKFKTVERSLGEIQAEFVHNPENLAASLQDYLEAQAEDGWDLVSMSGTLFVFKASGKSK